MKQGEIRCDKCVNWDRPREDRINGGMLGECHRNPPMNMDQYVPGYAVWTLTHDNDWCGEFRNSQMVVDAALPKPQAMTAQEVWDSMGRTLPNLTPSSHGDPQSTSHLFPLMTGGEVLDKIRASLRDYPAAGGDVVVMNEVDRIVREAVEKAEKTSVTRTTWESVKNMTTPAQKMKVDRCFCGGVGCNSCEPGGRG